MHTYLSDIWKPLICNLIYFSYSSLENNKEWIRPLTLLLQEGAPLPGPESGFLSNTGMWAVQGDTDKAGEFIAKVGPTWRSGQGNPGGLLWHVVRHRRFYGDGISFQVVSGQSFWLGFLPGGMCIAWPIWSPARRILGGWLDVRCLLLTFPQFFWLMMPC